MIPTTVSLTHNLLEAHQLQATIRIFSWGLIKILKMLALGFTLQGPALCSTVNVREINTCSAPSLKGRVLITRECWDGLVHPEVGRRK